MKRVSTSNTALLGRQETTHNHTHMKINRKRRESSICFHSGQQQKGSNQTEFG